VIYVLVLAAVIGLLLYRRKRRSAPRWRFYGSPGMPKAPTVSGVGWWFDFPTKAYSHVHYVQDFQPPALKPGMTLTARFRIDGDAGFVAQESPLETATVTLLVQRKGDDWSARGKYAAYRWYSGEQIALAPGEHVLRVPLTADAWGDVYGGHDPRAFADALANVENIGLVFGSPGGRGHGVYALGSARFQLISMRRGV
jgi:hypothetical protein